MGDHGTFPLCVILEDRSMYCIEQYDLPEYITNVSARVPGDNRAFAWIAATDWQDYWFYAGRTDGAIAAWWQSFSESTDKLPNGSYLSSWGDRNGICGLKNDGQITCDDPLLVPRYPKETYVDFWAGSAQANMYVGLRVDGALVFGLTLQPTGGPFYDKSQVFTGLSARGNSSFCATTQQHKLYCLVNADNASTRTLLLQPYESVRDFSEHSNHLCVIQDNGRAACRDVDQPQTVYKVPQDRQFVDIETAGKAHSCGVTDAGEVWCWDVDGNVHQIPLPMKAATL